MCLRHYNEICLIVYDWLEQRDALQNPRKVLRESGIFKELVDRVVTQVNCNLVELALTTALCAVGPQNEGPPPREVYDKLLALMRLLPRDEKVERCFEIVMAYGSGGWPFMRYPPFRTSWYGQWARAYLWLKEEAKIWIYRSFEWLNQTVISFEDTIISAWNGYKNFPMLDHPQRAIHQGIDLLAHEIVHLLIHNRCYCYMLEGGRTTSQHRQERFDRHILEHQIASWNPGKASLWNFIAQAIKGSMTVDRQFASGSFVQGLLYEMMYTDGNIKLRLGNVLNKYCRHHKEFYEGDRCPYCKQVHFDETTDARITRRLIVIPFSNNGPYMEEPWWHCKSCNGSSHGENYYPCRKCRPQAGRGIVHGKLHDKCPICGRGHAMRRGPSWVYVRQFGKMHKVGDNDDL